MFGTGATFGFFIQRLGSLFQGFRLREFRHYIGRFEDSKGITGFHCISLVYENFQDTSGHFA